MHHSTWFCCRFVPSRRGVPSSLMSRGGGRSWQQTSLGVKAEFDGRQQLSELSRTREKALWSLPCCGSASCDAARFLSRPHTFLLLATSHHQPTDSNCHPFNINMRTATTYGFFLLMYRNNVLPATKVPQIHQRGLALRSCRYPHLTRKSSYVQGQFPSKHPIPEAPPIPKPHPPPKLILQ